MNIICHVGLVLITFGVIITWMGFEYRIRTLENHKCVKKIEHIVHSYGYNGTPTEEELKDLCKSELLQEQDRESPEITIITGAFTETNPDQKNPRIRKYSDDTYIYEMRPNPGTYEMRSHPGPSLSPEEEDKK